jgi:hypothetical protein
MFIGNDEAGLQRLALRRVQRRRKLRQKALGIGGVLVFGAALAVVVGSRAGSPLLTLAMLLFVSLTSLIFFLIDMLWFKWSEGQDSWLHTEVERELEHLRDVKPKLKRGTLYRLGDDGELEIVESVEAPPAIPQQASERL